METLKTKICPYFGQTQFNFNYNYLRIVCTPYKYLRILFTGNPRNPGSGQAQTVSNLNAFKVVELSELINFTRKKSLLGKKLTPIEVKTFCIFPALNCHQNAC